MIRTIFCGGGRSLVFAAVSGTSQAAPIAPLPAGVIAENADQFCELRFGSK
jgi:hypothetical protein